MYRDALTNIDDLESHEQLALGGPIRVLIRIDGSFSEEEERYLEEVADAIGGRDALWAVISRSAQELADDSAIREVAKKVVRPEARVLIRSALEGIALAETITLQEQKLLDWVDETWDLHPVVTDESE